ncbi:MAG: hypothetical protein R3C03_14360 [Pirellulaceae bacterium]
MTPIMDNDLHLLAQILQKEKRYSLDAYLFVREGLSFASDHLELDSCCGATSDGHCVANDDTQSEMVQEDVEEYEQATPDRRHVTGQQLCEGIRRYALRQFGYMSKTVLNSWGIHSTSDIGAIVYRMINAGIMKKSSKDRRAHFDNVFDFTEAFENEFDFGTTCCRSQKSTL